MSLLKTHPGCLLLQPRLAPADALAAEKPSAVALPLAARHAAKKSHRSCCVWLAILLLSGCPDGDHDRDVVPVLEEPASEPVPSERELESTDPYGDDAA